MKTAQWSDDRCTWEVRVSDRAPGPKRSHSELAGGTLYQGTAGIGLYLAELYRHTHAPDVLAAAEGAIRHALEIFPPGTGVNFGFHSGRVGIAYACYRLGVVSDRDELLCSAEQVLAPLIGNAHRDGGIDVIGGAAGAIPVLLTMAEELPAAVTFDTALALGEHLLRSARRGVVGWSWPGMSSATRDLTGYAHGASGCGHALLELFAATGEATFRYAAEQAFAYERYFFSAEERNWPDFRHMDLSEYLSYGRTEALRVRLRTGGPFPAFRKTFMNAWCHGAPGIGLARLRAYELLKDQRYLDEAFVAIETTLERSREAANYSLCHGLLGNYETLLVADRLLGLPALREVAEQRAAEGYERFEQAGLAWPCGTLGGESDPSLLLGEAGIGHFFLRLHDSLTPSLLCPTPAATRPRPDVRPGSAESLRRAHVGQHFGTTIAAIERLQTDRDSVFTEVERLTGGPEMVRLHAVLEQRIATEPMPERRLVLADAFAVEQARFALDMQIDDFTTELLDNIVRPTVDELDWSTVTVTLADHVRLIHTCHDWQRWYGGSGAAAPTEPAVADIVTVVFRQGNEARAQAMGAFTALVLDSAKQAGTWVAITERVADSVANATTQQLAPPVLEQLKAAYGIGILTAVAPPSST